MTIIVKAAVAMIINYNRNNESYACKLKLYQSKLGRLKIHNFNLMGLYYTSDKANFYITILFYKCKCVFDWYF